MVDARFLQANREAWWSISLTVIYFFGWFFTGYSMNNKLGLLGLPRWFEMSCIYAPVFFIILCAIMIKYGYKDIPLD